VRDAVRAEDHLRLAYHIANRFRREDRDLEELEAEALLGLTIAAREHDAGRGKFSNLAGLVIERRLYRVLKRERKDEVLEPLMFVTDEGKELEREELAIEEDHDAGLLRGAVRRAVAELPERERCVIEESFFRGVSCERIGVKLGLTRERVQQVRSRALRRLRKRLAPADVRAKRRSSPRRVAAPFRAGAAGAVGSAPHRLGERE
jgi:RNA polymerase sigma factor (sigma-70 family)